MPKWIEILLPYVVPALLAVLTGAIASAVRTPKRLRKELAEEVQLIPGLPEVPANLLTHDIVMKTVQLSGWNKYPAMTPPDLIRLGAILSLAGLMAWGAADLSSRPPERLYWDLHLWPLGIYIGLVGQPWFSLYGSVVWRRRDRSAFWNEHGASRDEDEQSFAETVGSMALLSFGVIAVVGPPFVHVSLLLQAFDATDEHFGWVALGTTALAGVVFFSGTRAERSRPAGTRRVLRALFAGGERDAAEVADVTEQEVEAERLDRSSGSANQ